MTCSQTEPRKIAAQVQRIETNDLSKLPKSFRLYLSGIDHEEINASAELYRQIDDVTGKNNFETFENCRCFAWFSVSFVTRKVRVVSNSCRLRWCPLCSGSLSRYRTHSITEWLEEQVSPRFLTLTLKHSSDGLGEQIKKLYYYFKQLRKIVYFRRICTGGIWFFQVKRSSRTGEWHPHLHCLITGSYIEHPRLSAIWESITGGSTVVHIKTIRDENSISKYVSRYSSRPASLSEYNTSDRHEIYSVCHGKRLCGTWGTGKLCSLTPNLKADMSEWRKLGKWSTVVRHAPFMSYARLVYQCWKQDRAVPDFIDMNCLDAPEHLFTDTELQNCVLLTYFDLSLE